MGSIKEIRKIDRPLIGRIYLPGDKSVSFRALLLGPLAPGTRVYNVADIPLVNQAIAAMENLGAGIKRTDEECLEFTGYSGGINSGEINCGSSATFMRLAAGLLAGLEGTWLLSGDEQLSKRPMERIAEPLRKMGAEISTRDGYPPIEITGGGLKSIEFDLQVPSAQVKSAVLLAGLNAEGTTTVIESIPTRDHTERMLRAMGARISIRQAFHGVGIKIEGKGHLKPAELFIPGDISSAAYIIALAALVPGSVVTVADVLLNPYRVACLEHIHRMGADITIEMKNPESYEPYGDITVKFAGKLHNVPITETEVAGLIDEIPLLAMVGMFADGRFELSGAKELRVKETDRIASTVHNLRAAGVGVTEQDDGFTFEGRGWATPCKFDSYGDHRMALACYVAASLTGGCLLSGAEAASASYPGFEQDIAKLQTA